jgi:hypothetical protein
MNLRSLIFAAAIAAVVILSPQAFAADYFSTDFAGPPLHPSLEDPDSAFAIAFQQIQRNPPAHSEDRHYIRTVDNDYFTTGNFAFEVSFTNPVGDGIGTIQYIGLGSGTANEAYYREPGPPTGVAGTGTGSVYFRIHAPDIVDGRIDWAFNYAVPGEEVFVEQIGNIFTEGTHRARIAVKGDIITMQIDENYTGSFSPTISSTIDLALYPQIKTALLNESRAFFGTAQYFVTYDDFAIVPEPATGVLALAGMLGLQLSRRRNLGR